MKVLFLGMFARHFAGVGRRVIKVARLAMTARRV
jgi:hypothetical protein